MKSIFLFATLATFFVLNYAEETEVKEQRIANFYQSAKTNKTYFISANQTHTWYEAYIDCSFKGLALLTLDSDEKFLEIKELLQAEKLNKKYLHLWIGAIGSDRRFSWISTGKPMIINSKHWLVNNPDNHLKLENCVQIYGDYLNDRKGSDALGYACEERPLIERADSNKYKQFILNIGNRNV